MLRNLRWVSHVVAAMKRILATAVILLVSAPAASAQWTAPRGIEGTQDSFPNLAFARDSGLAAFTASTSYAFPPTSTVGGATVGADGSSGAARTLTDDFQLSELAAYGRDRVVMLAATFDRLPRTFVAFGRTGGALGAERDVVGRRAYPGDIATNSRGDVAVIVGVCTRRRVSCGRPVPHLIVRRAGGRFGHPIRLAPRGPSYSLDVAVNERGDVLAVYDRPLRGATGRRGVYGRMRTAAGRLGSERKLGEAVTIPRLSTALGAGRRAIVGWFGQRVGEGHAHPPGEAWVAQARPGRLFGEPQRLERITIGGTGRYVADAAVRVALDGARPIVAWTGYAGGRFVVKASHGEGGEIREPGAVLSNPARDTILGDMDRGGTGVMMIEGRRGADPVGTGPLALRAAVRRSGTTTFGAIETVQPSAGWIEAVDVETVPSSGRIVAVWRQFGPEVVGIASREPAG